VGFELKISNNLTVNIIHKFVQMFKISNIAIVSYSSAKWYSTRIHGSRQKRQPAD